MANLVTGQSLCFKSDYVLVLINLFVTLQNSVVGRNSTKHFVLKKGIIKSWHSCGWICEDCLKMAKIVMTYKEIARFPLISDTFHGNCIWIFVFLVKMIVLPIRNWYPRVNLIGQICHWLSIDDSVSFQFTQLLDLLISWLSREVPSSKKVSSWIW